MNDELSWELDRFRAEEAYWSDKPHAAQAAFYSRKVVERSPVLNLQEMAALAATHASLALVEALKR